ncbi:hypothetical protein KFE25_006589 [Diacronema lutheri]|uniref:Elongation of fatty acids protein n=2 Tax=Diacronema lutheri TaxID=2081491 RepID=A0A8J5X886_DIALT|nr:hypothetical protein KFE25_006589 [Diacronema lutheri]
MASTWLAWHDAFDGRKAAVWFLAHVHVPVGAALSYCAMLALLPRLMAARKPLQLHALTLYWNLALTLFSGLGAAHTLPTLWRVLRERGFKYSFCADVFEIVGGDGRGPPYFWAAAFVISKQLEFGDTALLLLKKKRATFLHTFHHVSVALLTWFGFATHAPVAMWCGTMNYTVHALMYGYYSAMASPTCRPYARPLAGCVTLLQIAQMVVACAIHIGVVGWRLLGEPCWWDPPMLLCTLGAYVVYLVLFAQIFVTRYLLPANGRATGKAD